MKATSSFLETNFSGEGEAVHFRYSGGHKVKFFKEVLCHDAIRGACPEEEESVG